MGRTMFSRWAGCFLVMLGLMVLTAILGGRTASADQSYVVQPGDTLSAIAARYGTTVEALAQANGLPDPNRISVGQVLVIPTPSGTAANAAPPITVYEGFIVGSAVPVYEAPSTASRLLGYLHERDFVRFNGVARGENWIIGNQGWVGVRQDWTDRWYHLDTGGWVYAAWIFFPREGEALPFNPGEGERWVDVNLTTQTLRAMVGERAVLVAPVTTGVGSWATPEGSFRLHLRVENERMTSVQAGITTDYYDVSRVLFTQYFTPVGHALHLNYWRPEHVFGREPTSHGCVGILLHDAQYLWLFAVPHMRVEVHS